MVHHGSAVPNVGPGTAELEAAQRLHDGLVRSAVELAQLAEHHRRELSDTMAELTRLQRQVRAETRSAIEELRRLATTEADRSGAAERVAAEDPPGTREAVEPLPRRLRKRLGLSRS
jgi:ABC-type transporter Mla subunit MlaD